MILFFFLLPGIHILIEAPQFPDDSLFDENFKIEATKDAFHSFFKKFDIVLDCFFGFSFVGSPRDPYQMYIKSLANLKETNVKVLSVDIPSGKFM